MPETAKSILDPRVRNALEDSGIQYEVLECAAELADTAEFCAHYGIDATEACNAIVVVVKSEPRRYVACLVRSDTRLDVNKRVSALVGVKRLSFASADETTELTGQMIGGVSIAGLPSDMPLYIDEKVMEQPRVIIGGGNRTSKARLDPRELLKLPNAQVAAISAPPPAAGSSAPA
jgi:prolyl-tRNA editing enzyme YbaK/EbsC (Cys-tRNA(Pro) deacylase)